MSTLNQFLDHQLSSKKAVPDYSQKFIEFIKKANGIVGDQNEKDLKGVTSTPDYMIKFCDMSKNYGEYINAFLSVVSRFKPIYSIPTRDECIADFTAIAAEVVDGKILYDNYSQSFVFNKEIVMNDVYRDIQFNFGEFKFILKQDKVEFVPIKNNTVKGNKTHPYMLDNNKLCLGTFLEQYKAAMKTLRYHLAYSIVMQCVTNYGGDQFNGTAAGPASPIMQWVGQICSVCDNSVMLDKMALCSKTNRAICPACIDTGLCTDEVDKETYHPDLIKECKSCNKKSGTVIRNKCLACRQKALTSA